MLLFGAELFIFVFVLFIFWYWKKVWIYPRNFPPGPRFPLPIVGDALSLGMDLSVGLKNLHKKYGNLVGFSMGSHLAVSVRDFATIQKILHMEEYSRRPPVPGLNLYRRPDKTMESEDSGTSLAMTDGPLWKSMSRFTKR